MSDVNQIIKNIPEETLLEILETENGNKEIIKGDFDYFIDFLKKELACTEKQTGRVYGSN